MSYTDLTKVLTRPLFQHLYAPTPCSPLHLATLYTSICSTFCFFTIALHCTYSQVVQYIQYSTFSSTTNPVPVPPSFTSARVTMKATREREMKDLLHHSCENHNIITSCSTFLIYYIIVSSGAPLFVNFVLINLSLIVTYNLLCCIQFTAKSFAFLSLLILIRARLRELFAFSRSVMTGGKKLVSLENTGGIHFNVNLREIQIRRLANEPQIGPKITSHRVTSPRFLRYDMTQWLHVGV